MALTAPAVAGDTPSFVVARKGVPLLLRPGSDSFVPVRNVLELCPRRPIKTDENYEEWVESDPVRCTGPVCFVDRAARLAAAKAFEKAELDDLGRRLSYLARIDMPGPVEVLTAVLARKFVAPTDTQVGSLQMWAKAFDVVGHPNDPEALRTLWALCDGALTGTQSRVWKPFVKTVGWLPLTLAGTPGDAFRAVSSAYDTWETVRRLDPIGRDEGVVDGTVAHICERPKLLGGIAEAKVSVPFRVRDGRVTLFDTTGDWDLVLEGTVYSGGSLAARFLEPSEKKSGKSKHQAAYSRLHEAGPDSPLWVTNPSWSTGPASKLTERWVRRTARPNAPAAPAAVQREIPLHVVLAGAGG